MGGNNLIARLRRCIQARTVWEHINYPIYIPEELTDIAALLGKGDVVALEGELKRRAQLGSASAASVLGYLEMIGAFSGKPEPQAAIRHCARPAQAGNGYAQYVLAWAHARLGNGNEALREMARSADSGFLPALVDYGKWHVGGAANVKERRNAVRLLWAAHNRGHVTPLVAISGIACRGQLGPIYRVLGVVLFPYAMIRLMLRWRCEPLGIRSFRMDHRPNVPLFSRIGGSKADLHR
jgi:hypothetical protein